jgi:hypothetical protein
MGFLHINLSNSSTASKKKPEAGVLGTGEISSPCRIFLISFVNYKIENSLPYDLVEMYHRRLGKYKRTLQVVKKIKEPVELYFLLEIFFNID